MSHAAPLEALPNQIEPNSLKLDAPVVIIGAGPVGVRAAQQFSTSGKSVVLFNAEKVVPYNRVKLTPLLSGEAQVGQVFQPDVFSGRDEVHRYDGVSVIDIDRGEKTVTTSTGRVQPYEKLIIAVGSRAFVPRIPGVELANIYTFRDFGDTEALLSRSFSARNALVVGGGLLGLEAARGIAGRGAKVTVVEHEACLMPNQLDTTAAALLKERIEDLGITVLTSTRVKQFIGSDRVEAAQFEGADERRFDTVVICTGVRANTQLAAAAELAVGRGIKVDSLMRSSDPDIYAIGECAEVDGYVTGLVGPGFEQATVAVENIVTQSTQTKFESSIDACKLKVIGVDVFSMGDFASVEQQGNVQSYIYHATEDRVYRRIFLRRGKIIAALGVGDWPDVAKIQAASGRGQSLYRWHLRRFERTGLIWPASDDSALNLPSDAIICNCTGVTKAAIRNAITLGASTPEELQLATSCSTVCGTCKPLVAELLGQGDTAPEPARWFKALTHLSAIAAFLALLTILAPRIPLAETFTKDELFRSLWFDSLWKQYSGYTLLGLSVLAALIGLRKRISFLSRVGGYDFWRITHLGIGLCTALVLVWHTGFRLGSNLNLLLMLAFLTVLVFGAIAGLATGRDHDLIEKGLSSATKPARRMPLWLHIIGLWPLPILIFFHVLVVYAY